MGQTDRNNVHITPITLSVAMFLATEGQTDKPTERHTDKPTEILLESPRAVTSLKSVGLSAIFSQTLEAMSTKLDRSTSGSLLNVPASSFPRSEFKF